jgi:hypothetical protein
MRKSVAAKKFGKVQSNAVKDTPAAASPSIIKQQTPKGQKRKHSSASAAASSVPKAGEKQDAASTETEDTKAEEEPVADLKMGELRNRSGGKRMRAAQERHDEVLRKRAERQEAERKDLPYSGLVNKKARKEFADEAKQRAGEFNKGGATAGFTGQDELLAGQEGRGASEGEKKKAASTAHANIEAMAEAACAREVEEEKQRASDKSGDGGAGSGESSSSASNSNATSTALTTTGRDSSALTAPIEYGSAADDVPAGPSLQMMIVDGKMVLNQSTLTVSTEREENEEYEEVHEKHGGNANLTSASYSNRGPAERWSIADTRRFYQCLRECGTNFQFIVQLMPGRTRRQVKAKFKKEERERPDLVDQALNSSLPLGLDEFNDSAKAAKQAQTYKVKAKALEAPRKKKKGRASRGAPPPIESGGYTTGKANEKPPEPQPVALMAVPVPADAQTYEV